MSGGQQARFRGLVLAYNIVAYPLCVGIACRLAAPAFLALRAIERGRPIGAGAAAEARRAALGWPLRMVALSCVGWFPGGIIFPVALSMGAGAGPPLGPDACGHFLASFWISGLIALTYSYFGVEASPSAPSIRGSGPTPGAPERRWPRSWPAAGGCWPPSSSWPA